jgi:hypothetical protein
MNRRPKPIPVVDRRGTPLDARRWLDAMPEEHRLALKLMGIAIQGWSTAISAFVFRKGTTIWCFKQSWPPDRPVRVMLDHVASGRPEDYMTYWPRLEASTAESPSPP